MVRESDRHLICPKCGGEMEAHERNRVTIDECVNCRGIFLDRGEMERLIDAEGGYYRDRGGYGRGEHQSGGFLGSIFGGGHHGGGPRRGGHH